MSSFRLVWGGLNQQIQFNKCLFEIEIFNVSALNHPTSSQAPNSLYQTMRTLKRRILLNPASIRKRVYYNRRLPQNMQKVCQWKIDCTMSSEDLIFYSYPNVLISFMEQFQKNDKIQCMDGPIRHSIEISAASLHAHHQQIKKDYRQFK